MTALLKMYLVGNSDMLIHQMDYLIGQEHSNQYFRLAQLTAGKQKRRIPL